MNTAYFAHPMRTYGSKGEGIILSKIAKKGWKVINPADYSNEAKKLSPTWLPCAKCKDIIMKPLFYQLVKSCQVFVYWNPLGTCGVECEFKLAKRLKKKIYRPRIDI